MRTPDAPRRSPPQELADAVSQRRDRAWADTWSRFLERLSFAQIGPDLVRSEPRLNYATDLGIAYRSACGPRLHDLDSVIKDFAAM